MTLSKTAVARALFGIFLPHMIACSSSDSGPATGAVNDALTTSCGKGYVRVCSPDGSHGMLCECDPVPDLACEFDLIASWQQSMPSLGYASTPAAQAIDRAIQTTVDVAALNHPQFVGGRWPGVSVAITQGSKLVFAKSYGFANMSVPRLVQPDDLFRLASDSKQLTGATILKLIKNGQSVDGVPSHPLTLDSKVFAILSGAPNAILPAGGLAALSPALQNITVREVLEHTGGWAYNAGDPVTYAGVPGAILPVTETNVVKYMETQSPYLSSPGIFSYSNFG